MCRSGAWPTVKLVVPFSLAASCIGGDVAHDQILLANTRVGPRAAISLLPLTANCFFIFIPIATIYETNWRGKISSLRNTACFALYFVNINSCLRLSSNFFKYKVAFTIFSRLVWVRYGSDFGVP